MNLGIKPTPLVISTDSTQGIPNMGIINISNNTGAVGRLTKTDDEIVEEIIDRYALNEFSVEHRVQEQELLKLKETNVDYGDHIKENLAKACARDLMKKMTFTKKHEQDTFVHSFRGRVWVFNKEELKQLIKDIKNGVQ